MTETESKFHGVWSRVWWIPLAIIAVGIAVASFLLRYQPPNYESVISKLDDSTQKLDTLFAGEQNPKSLKFVRRSTYSGAGQSVISTITSEVTPIRNGWVLRVDNWRDQYNQALLYQERYVLYRGLFGVHTQFRDIAPFFHELFGSLGWFNDYVESMDVATKMDFLNGADGSVFLTQKRTADTDWRSAAATPTKYERRIECKRNWAMLGAKIHPSIRGQVSISQCTSTYTNDFPSRTSRVAYLADHGVFVTLESSASSGERSESTANEFLEFEAK